MRHNRPAMVRGKKEKGPPTCYTPAELRDTLPQAGTWLRKVPTLKKATDEKPVPLRCRVVYVNTAHLWYTVEFPTAMGHTFREAYKVPEKERH